MTTCDLCPRTAIWLLTAESLAGAGMTSVACQADVDIARALLARIGSTSVIPLDETMIPEGT